MGDGGDGYSQEFPVDELSWPKTISIALVLLFTFFIGIYAFLKICVYIGDLWARTGGG